MTVILYLIKNICYSQAMFLVARVLLLLLVFLALPVFALPPDDTVTHCESVGASTPWSFCVHSAPKSRNPDRLYYFHGIGETHSGWYEKQYAHALHRIWSQSPLGPPTIISISFARVWFLAEYWTGPMGGLLEVTADQVIPSLERYLGPLAQDGKRILHGESMGGFNALQIYFKAPHLFERISTVCPIISTIGPYSSLSEIQAYVQRTGSQLWRVLGALGLGWSFFPSLEAWNSADPLVLMKRHPHPQSPIPQLYLSWANRDEYGIAEGSKNFVETLKKIAPQKIYSMEVEGSHCVVDPDSLARFITGESQSN